MVGCPEESRTSATSSPLLQSSQDWLPGCRQETLGLISSDRVKLPAEEARSGRFESSYVRGVAGRGWSSFQQNRVLLWPMREVEGGESGTAPWEVGGVPRDQQ